MDLPGDTAGASRRRPIACPTKKAKLSENTMITSSSTIRQAPSDPGGSTASAAIVPPSAPRYAAPSRVAAAAETDS